MFGFCLFDWCACAPVRVCVCVCVCFALFEMYFVGGGGGTEEERRENLFTKMAFVFGSLVWHDTWVCS